MIRNAELSKETLVNAVDSLMLDETKRQQMATASKKEGIQDATDRLYHLIEGLTS